MKETILVIDDDQDLLDLLSLQLGKEEFKVLLASDGKSGFEMVKNKKPDLVVLDINMPKMSGMELCKALRSEERTSDVPIIMLTAKNEEIDRVLGLEFGADDYLTKPFSPRELILRIKSILKRTHSTAKSQKSSVQYGILTVSLSRHEVKVKNKVVPLTLTEFKLLASLFDKPGQIKTRDYLLEQIWDYGDGVYSRTIDTHVQRLRAKLKDAGRYIETVRGVGYRLHEDI